MATYRSDYSLTMPTGGIGLILAKMSLVEAKNL
jgi:hypothetical protein